MQATTRSRDYKGIIQTMPTELWIYNQFNDRKTTLPISDDTILVGREATNQVCLQSPFISRVHAKLIREADRWFVESVGLNGAIIADQVGKSGQRHLIRPGEEIRLGEFSLYLVDRGNGQAVVGRRTGPSPARQALEIE